MSIVASDLRAFPSGGLTTHIEDDVTSLGGAFVPGATYGSDFGVWNSEATGVAIQMLAGAGDTTQTLKIRTRDGVTGALATSDVMTFNAATPVAILFGGLAKGVFYIEWIELSAAVFVGDVQVQNVSSFLLITVNTNLAFPKPRTITRMFVNASSPISGTTVRYEKLFWANTNSSLTALNPVYRLTADPQTIIRQGVHTSKNDSASIANRVTVPGGITFVDDNIDQTGSDIGPISGSDYQGMWIEQTATVGAGPFFSSFTTQMTVNSI